MATMRPGEVLARVGPTHTQEIRNRGEQVRGAGRGLIAAIPVRRRTKTDLGTCGFDAIQVCLGVQREGSPPGYSGEVESVSPGLLTYVAEAPSDTHAVAALEVGDRSLRVAWGRLVVPLLNLTSWTMDLETISYGLLDTGEYDIQVTLADGRSLSGKAVLAATNGRLYRFESRGEWPELRPLDAVD